MLRFRPSGIEEQPSTGGSTQQSFDIPLSIPSFFSPSLFCDQANLKRSFPRDFIQPDDRKRPLVQTGTVWKSFSSPRRISRSSPSRIHSRLDHPFHHQLSLPISQTSKTSSSTSFSVEHPLSLSQWNSNPREKRETFLVSSNFPFIDRVSLFLSIRFARS